MCFTGTLGAKARAFQCKRPWLEDHDVKHKFKSARRKTVTQWVEEFYEVIGGANPGPWKARRARWALSFLEDVGNDNVTRLGVRASAQAAKSESGMAGCAYSQDQDPDASMWVTSSASMASEFCIERLMPALDKIKHLSSVMPKDRTKKKTKAIHFKSHSFDVVGAASITQLQSKPRRFLWLDEVRNWAQDRLPTVMKRVGTFWNEKIVVISTPGLEGDSVDTFFMDGDQRHWHVPCPNKLCIGADGRRFHAPLDFKKCMRWDENDETFPNGLNSTPDFEKMAKTIRYECSNCGHVSRDDVHYRDYIVQKGFWVRHNPKAPKGYHTYTWSKMIVPLYSWRKIVQEYLEAQRALMRGNFAKLQMFITETLGLPFNERMKYGEDEDPLEKRKGTYRMGDTWADAKYRILTVDVQARELYYVCREWSEKGHSRLVAHGVIPKKFDLLRGVIAELKPGRKGILNDKGDVVDPDRWYLNQNYVCIDSGKWTAAVYSQCVASGYQWKPFKGAGEKQRKSWKDENGVVQIYTQSEVDPYLGKRKAGMPTRPLVLTSLNDFAAQDILNIYINGLGLPWEIPEDVDQEYIKGVMSAQRTEIVDPYGFVKVEYVKLPDQDDHYRDCEKMQFIAAMLCDILKEDEPEEPKARGPIPEEKKYGFDTLPEPDFDMVYHLLDSQ